MAQDEDPEETLQRTIAELAQFPTAPEAEWVERLRRADRKALVGLILRWLGHTGLSMGPDPLASRREAAQAILQTRLLDDVASAVSDVESSVESLEHTIGTFEQASRQQTESMLRLTRRIAWLTAVMLAAVIAQIVIAVIALRH